MQLLDHDNVLSSQVGDMGQEERERNHRLRRLLLKLSKETGILPTVLFLTDVVPESTENRADWGGYADIYKATLDGQSVALKRLRNFSRDRNRGQARDRPGGSGYFTSSMQAFCREAIVWRQLKHRHILPFLGVDRFAFPSRLCMVSPWMPYGNINQCMSELIADDCHIPRDRWVRPVCSSASPLLVV